MRKLFFALPLLTSLLSAQSSSQQSYALNIPDTSIASPPCQDTTGHSKKPKKAQSSPAGCTVASDLKKATDAPPKAESGQPSEKQKATTP